MTNADESRRSPEAGNTKCGKGTKILLLVDGRGVPLSVMTIEANVAEVNTIETLVDIQVAGKRPKHLLSDRMEPFGAGECRPGWRFGIV